MTHEQQALIILENMDKSLQINWNIENVYIAAIVKGLKEVETKKAQGTGIPKR